MAQERSLENAFRKEVKALGCFYIKMPAMWLAGLPDRLFLLPNGTAFFIEWKRPGGKLRPIQVYMGNKLRKLGFKVYVINNTKAARKIFRDEYQASIE